MTEGNGSNEQRWASPGASPSPAPPVPPIAPPPEPRFTGQNAGSTHAPVYGYSTGYGTGAQPGWTPPPKPGLIPLRPLDLGTILGASFRVLRRNPKATFGAALLIQGSVYLLLILVVAGVTFGALSRIDSSSTQNADQITAGATGLIVVASIIPGLLAVVAAAVLQGIIVLEVSRGAVGEKLSLGSLWKRARGRIGALIGWAALLVLASTVVIGIIVVIIVLLVVSLGNGGIVAAVIIGILAFFGLAVVYVWLSTKLALVPSALMIERMTIRSAVARSWSLTEGYFWRTFGISALVAVIVGIVSQVVTFPINFIAPIATGLIDPQGQNGTGTVVLVAVLSLLVIVVAVVFQSITSVVQSATTGLLYLDLRIRKEGLDLELVRYVEAKQTDPAVTDPLLHGAPVASRPVPDESPWA
ncbi:membrane protein [soil metagenome]